MGVIPNSTSRISHKIDTNKSHAIIPTRRPNPMRLFDRCFNHRCHPMPADEITNSPPVRLCIKISYHIVVWKRPSYNPRTNRTETRSGPPMMTIVFCQNIRIPRIRAEGNCLTGSSGGYTASMKNELSFRKNKTGSPKGECGLSQTNPNDSQSGIDCGKAIRQGYARSFLSAQAMF